MGSVFISGNADYKTPIPDRGSGAVARPFFVASGLLRHGIMPPFSRIGMALKSTIFKAELQLADLDRSHFADYSLTIARHPSDFPDRQLQSVN